MRYTKLSLTFFAFYRDYSVLMLSERQGELSES